MAHYVKLFEQFLSEKSHLTPEQRMARGIDKTREKIASLKNQIIDKPERREVLLAMINVEQEKLDVLIANQELYNTKERFATKEENRKRTEKIMKERTKKRAEIEKEIDRRLKAQQK